MDNLLNLYVENETEIAKVNDEISLAIAEQQQRVSTLIAKNEELKEQIKSAMESNGTKKYENDLIAITYVEPTTRVTVDSKKLKELHEDIYNECSKVSNVKSSIRIKVKENKEEHKIDYEFDESQF